MALPAQQVCADPREGQAQPKPRVPQELRCENGQEANEDPANHSRPGDGSSVLGGTMPSLHASAQCRKVAVNANLPAVQEAFIFIEGKYEEFASLLRVARLI